MAAKIIIDTDPGVDDAMAILFALRSPELEVVGLTSVFGNADVEHTTLNALRLVELEGFSHIPVAKGADYPIVRPRGRLGTFVHGEDGAGNTHPPLPQGKPLDIPAAQFIVETILDHPGEITLVPIGPFTNIGLALLLAPEIAKKVKEVVIMGGSAYDRGNASPAAEANAHNDPEATRLVFTAGWPLTMVGLDATHKCIMTKEYLEGLANTGNKATNFIAQILPFYQAYHQQWHKMGGAIHTHDPSAIAYLIDRTLFKTRSMPVFVEVDGMCAGDTVPDPFHMWIETPLTNVCLDVDSPRLLALYRERLTR